MADVVIPLSIDSTDTVEVSAALNAFFAAQADGTRIIWQTDGIYRCESTLLVQDRVGIEFIGNGATIHSVVTAPHAFTITDGVIEADGKHITSASAPFHVLKTTVYAWYVTGPGIPAGARAGKAQYIDDAHISLVVSSPATPGSGLTIKFTSPQDRDRSHLRVVRGSQFHATDLIIAGPNTGYGTYNSTLEAQHGIEIVGCHDFEIENVHAHHVWGDACAIVRDSVNNVLPSGYLHDNEFSFASRHDMSIAGMSNFLLGPGVYSRILNNNLHDAKRHIVDVEPNDARSDCQYIDLSDNTMARGGLGTLAISAYAGVDVFVGYFKFNRNAIDDTLNIPIGGNLTSHSTRWGPFQINDNVATTYFGTGTQGQTNTNWATIPAVVKFQYCDGVEVKRNTMKLQGGRGMFGVWCQFTTDIDVSDNDVSLMGPAPDHELHTVPYQQSGNYYDLYSDKYGDQGQAGPPDLGKYSDFYSDLYGIAGQGGGGGGEDPPDYTEQELEAEAKAQTRKSNTMVVVAELYNVVAGKEVLVATTYTKPRIYLTDGSDTGQRQSSVSRQLSITVVDPDGVFTPDESHHKMDPLARPILKISRGVRYRSRLARKVVTRLWPRGTFVITGCNVQEDDKGIATLAVSGSDRSVLISANTFQEPYDIIGGPKYNEAIMQIIVDRAGSRFLPKFNFEVSDHDCPDMTLATGADGWAEAQKLAEADGKELFVDVTDTFVLRTIPDPKKVAVSWEFNEGDKLGLLPGKNRNISIDNAYNGVTCVGSAPWLLYDVRATAWDDDPDSITYYLGTFGQKPYEIEDAMVANADQALLAAQKELLNRLGVMEEVSFSGLPAPFLQEGQVILAKSQNIRLSARSMIETIEMPLTAQGSMSASIRRQRQDFAEKPPPPLPVISLLTPNQGITLGGTLVVIQGTGLLGTIDVQFDGISADGITIIDDTRINCTTPAHPEEEIFVVVTTDAGDSLKTPACLFSYLTTLPSPGFGHGEFGHQPFGH